MNSLIIYHSKTGTTRDLGFEIRNVLDDTKINTSIKSLAEVSADDIKNADILFFGCWTKGLFIIMQHPDKEWKKFIEKIPEIKTKKVAFFTTYKVVTGSMFNKMRKAFNGNLPDDFRLFIKSKNGIITSENKEKILTFVKP
jgi:flavodoxin